jgi:hypothetical protein
MSMKPTVLMLRTEGSAAAAAAAALYYTFDNCNCCAEAPVSQTNTVYSSRHITFQWFEE